MEATENTTEPTLDKTRSYKIFISYCWSSPEHENWVYTLAERLMNDGVEVKYDKWDLKEGQDKYAFMESMVNDATINKVLVICEKGYKEKADSRSGGVGTETQIITSELYEKVEQTKFIPIIAEQGEKYDSYMPTFIKSRIGIDLSSSEAYEDGYEQLLRTIAERPKHRRPQLGSMPSYLFEDESNNYKTKNIIQSFKNNLYKNPQQATLLIDDFLEEFTYILNSFQIHNEDLKEPYDDVIYNKIHDMRKLRDDYIIFLDNWSKAEALFDIDKVVSLFEKIYMYNYYQGKDSYAECQMDHYRFFITELFLYTTAILIKNQSYKALGVLLNTKYFIDKKYSSDDKPEDFTIFLFDNKSLEYRKQRLNSNLFSITADTIINRATVNGTNYKYQIIDADLLLYYISHLKNQSIYCSWFPMTYVYADNSRFNTYKLDIFRRLISKRHFEKIKFMFGVNTVEDMKTLFKTFNEEQNTNMRYSGAWHAVMPIKYHINPDEIATSI